jgi:steroid delta-isomerase-like uncharacterized protein
MTAEQTATPQEVAAAIFTALNDRDLDALERLQHDGVRGNFIVIADFHGKPAVRQFFEQLFKAVPDFRLDIVRISGDGEYATVQWNATGRFTGRPFQGIHATGRAVDLQGVDVMHIVDGRLKDNTIYYDGLRFARQIGLLPAESTLADKAIASGFNLKTDAVAGVRSLLRRNRSPAR